MLNLKSIEPPQAAASPAADRPPARPVVTLPFAPRIWQIPLINDPAPRIVAVVHRRAGKALEVTTPIMTASGSFKPIGEIERGDMIFDEAGEVCHVTAAHPIMHNRPCYAVTFDDGQQIVCDEDHLWYTETKTDRTHRVERYAKGAGRKGKRPSGLQQRRPGTVKTTAIIRDTLRARGESNHAVPFAGPLDFPDAVLPIEPYILGLWLGDGASLTARFTTMDPEIAAELRTYAAANEWRFTTIATKGGQGLASTYAVAGVNGRPDLDSLTGRLRKSGIIGNKHIPQAYLCAGYSQRLDLLRGIMDTDGSVDPRCGRRCEITQKILQLAEDIVALIRGLGGNPRLSEKWINGRIYHRITFSPSFNPFRLSRKASLFKAPTPGRHAFGGMRRIVSVEAVESRPVRCITVDSPSHLYLAGEGLVPTHNSTALMWRGIRRCLVEPKIRVVHLLPFNVQWSRTGLWDQLAIAADSIPGAVVRRSELAVKFPNGSIYQAGGGDNPDSWRGGGAHEVIVDEYDDTVPSLVPLVIEPMLADTAGTLVRSGTPKGRGLLQAAYDRAKTAPGYSSYLLDYTKTGVLSEESIARLKREMTDEEFQQELMCSFAAPNSGSYYGKLMDEAERDGRITIVPHDPILKVWTSWDLGIDDSTAIWCCQISTAGQWRLIDYIEGSGEALEYYVGILRSKPYLYERHLLPHDAEVRELGSGRTRTETLRGLGVQPHRIVRQHNVADGIQAVRSILPKCWFDAEHCAVGIKALRNYRREWNENAQAWRSVPVHDFASHAADSLRYLALGVREGERRGLLETTEFTRFATPQAGNAAWMSL